jgi:type VI secretion system protein VasD
LLGKEEFVLSPGETKTFAKKLSPDTRFLGVVAAYRDLERARWRSTVAIQPGQKHQVTIRAGAMAVEASVAK